MDAIVGRQPKSIEERRSILQKEINNYVRRGYRVVSQTDTTAQLVKPKKFSLFWAIVWFLVLIVGLVVYLFYYAAKRDETVYIQVDENGHVRRS